MSKEKPFKFTVAHSGGEYRVIRTGDDPDLVIFRAATEAKAAAFLQVYLTLPIEDRIKLREACA